MWPEGQFRTMCVSRWLLWCSRIRFEMWPEVGYPTWGRQSILGHCLYCIQRRTYTTIAYAVNIAWMANTWHRIERFFIQKMSMTQNVKTLLPLQLPLKHKANLECIENSWRNTAHPQIINLTIVFESAIRSMENDLRSANLRQSQHEVGKDCVSVPVLQSNSHFAKLRYQMVWAPEWSICTYQPEPHKQPPRRQLRHENVSCDIRSTFCNFQNHVNESQSDQADSWFWR